MSKFGISIYSSTGKEMFSTKHSTWSYFDSFTVDTQAQAGNTTLVKTYPHYIGGMEIIVQRSFLDAVPSDQEAVIPTYEWAHTLTNAQTGAGTATIRVKRTNSRSMFIVLIR